MYGEQVIILEDQDNRTRHLTDLQQDFQSRWYANYSIKLPPDAKPDSLISAVTDFIFSKTKNNGTDVIIIGFASTANIALEIAAKNNLGIVVLIVPDYIQNEENYSIHDSFIRQLKDTCVIEYNLKRGYRDRSELYQGNCYHYAVTLDSELIQVKTSIHHIRTDKTFFDLLTEFTLSEEDTSCRAFDHDDESNCRFNTLTAQYFPVFNRENNESIKTGLKTEELQNITDKLTETRWFLTAIGKHECSTCRVKVRKVSPHAYGFVEIRFLPNGLLKGRWKRSSKVENFTGEWTAKIEKSSLQNGTITIRNLKMEKFDEGFPFLVKSQFARKQIIKLLAHFETFKLSSRRVVKRSLSDGRWDTVQKPALYLYSDDYTFELTADSDLEQLFDGKKELTIGGELVNPGEKDDFWSKVSNLKTPAISEEYSLARFQKLAVTAAEKTSWQKKNVLELPGIYSKWSTPSCYPSFTISINKDNGELEFDTESAEENFRILPVEDGKLVINESGAQSLTFFPTDEEKLPEVIEKHNVSGLFKFGNDIYFLSRRADWSSGGQLTRLEKLSRTPNGTFSYNTVATFGKESSRVWKVSDDKLYITDERDFRIFNLKTQQTELTLPDVFWGRGANSIAIKDNQHIYVSFDCWLAEINPVTRSVVYYKDKFYETNMEVEVSKIHKKMMPRIIRELELDKKK